MAVPVAVSVTVSVAIAVSVPVSVTVAIPSAVTVAISALVGCGGRIRVPDGTPVSGVTATAIGRWTGRAHAS